MSTIFSHTFSYKGYSIDLLDEFFKPSDFEYDIISDNTILNSIATTMVNIVENTITTCQQKAFTKNKIDQMLSDLNEMIKFFPTIIFSDTTQSIETKLTSKSYWASCVWNILCFAPASYEKKYKLNYQTNYKPNISKSCTTKSCIYCKKIGIDMLNCNTCGVFYYCNMLCQRYDYDIHKYECIKVQTQERSQYSSIPSVKLEILCSFCKKIGLKNDIVNICSRCLLVKYCDEKCQEHHWPDHKQNCIQHNLYNLD